ncbi:MAG: hypothetical protein RL085_563, partial [Actinomycetota bacterium]
SIVSEIKTATDSGLRVGLVHAISNVRPVAKVAPVIRHKVDFDSVVMLLAGDEVQSKVLKVIEPEALLHLSLRRPKVKAATVVLVGDASAAGAAEISTIAKDEFAGKATWSGI